MTVNSAEIRLSNIRLFARHGVLPQEKVTGGQFSVSLRVKADISKACENDNVADTINYATMYEIVKEEMAIPSSLIENVAYRIGQRIVEMSDKVEEVEVAVGKDNPPMGADSDGASVIINIKR